jgi:hypothetical protein
VVLRVLDGKCSLDAFSPVFRDGDARNCFHDEKQELLGRTNRLHYTDTTWTIYKTKELGGLHGHRQMGDLINRIV